MDRWIDRSIDRWIDGSIDRLIVAQSYVRIHTVINIDLDNETVLLSASCQLSFLCCLVKPEAGEARLLCFSLETWY